MLTKVAKMISNQMVTQMSVLNTNMTNAITKEIFISNGELNLASIQPITQTQSIPYTNEYATYESIIVTPTKEANQEKLENKKEKSPPHLTAVKIRGNTEENLRGKMYHPNTKGTDNKKELS